MGNILGIRSLLTQPPYAILCDTRAHFLTVEGGGVFTFTGAVPQPVLASNGRYLTLEDIQPHVKVHRKGVQENSAPTRVIALENTLDGMIMPLSEMRRISKFAHENDIKLHLDGARLWEAVVAGAESPGQYQSLLSDHCSLFDTVTMCFSKGLGAPVGSILVGSQAVIHQARQSKHSIGGDIRQPGIVTACALTAVKTTFQGGLLKKTHEVAKQLATFWEERCHGKLLYPTDTNIVWLDFSGQNFALEDLEQRAQQKGVFVRTERIIIHYRKYITSSA